MSATNSTAFAGATDSLAVLAILFLFLAAVLTGAAMGLCQYAFGRIGLRIRAIWGARRTRRQGRVR